MVWSVGNTYRLTENWSIWLVGVAAPFFFWNESTCFFGDMYVFDVSRTLIWLNNVFARTRLKNVQFSMSYISPRWWRSWFRSSCQFSWKLLLRCEMFKRRCCFFFRYKGTKLLSLYIPKKVCSLNVTMKSIEARLSHERRKLKQTLVRKRWYICSSTVSLPRFAGILWVFKFQIQWTLCRFWKVVSNPNSTSPFPWRSLSWCAGAFGLSEITSFSEVKQHH